MVPESPDPPPLPHGPERLVNGALIPVAFDDDAIMTSWIADVLEFEKNSRMTLP